MDIDKVRALSDAELTAALAADGKLVKRPVLVLGSATAPKAVLVGFAEEAYEKAFER